MKHIIQHLFIFVLIAFFPLISAKAQVSKIASITALEGEVSLKRAGSDERIDINEGTEVYLGDQIETLNDDSAAEITFIDDTFILVSGEDGELIINEYVYDPKSLANNKARFSLLRASFVYVGGLLSKNDDPDVEIELAFGSIGIRGTTLWRTMADEQCWIYLEEGEISVSNKAGALILNQGEGTRLSDQNVAPLPKTKWDQQRIGWIKDKINN